jgi:CrcB protein
MTGLGAVTMGTVGAVAAGAAVGAPLRYLVDRVVTDRVTRSAADRFAGASGAALFPWGLLVVNVLGSLLAGVVVAATSGDLRTLLLVGFCGAFTTFSGFAWETDRLWPESRSLFWLAIVAFPLACVVAFFVAWRLTTLVAG